MYRRFRNDPYFFLKYNTWTVVFYVVMSWLLLHFWSSLDNTQYIWVLFLCIIPLALPNIWTISLSALSLVPAAMYFDFFVFTGREWLLIIAGVFIGLQSAYLMHNAAHLSVGPRWFNSLVGELCGLQQLMGFASWAVPHVIHHQYPDDPEKDPHPPGHLSFWEFLNQMGGLMAKVVEKNFFKLWGEKAKYKKLWKLIVASSMLARYMRAAFLLILLGPKVFVFCFIVSKMVNLVWYVHFNYCTHRPTKNGEMEILNLDHNFYYWFINATMAGVYYHKNHHLKASLYDPRKLKRIEDNPVISNTYNK